MTNDNSQAMGKAAEEKFIKCFQSYGHKVTHSNKHQDMMEHWDFLVNDRYKVEVKSRKKAKRQDKQVNDEWIYVEFRNVKGNKGWLYGQADFIAFERPTGFLMVVRLSLVRLAESKIQSTWSDRPTPYKSYRRDNRPYEHVGVLLIEDVLTLNHKLIKFKG